MNQEGGNRRMGLQSRPLRPVRRGSDPAEEYDLLWEAGRLLSQHQPDAQAEDRHPSVWTRFLCLRFRLVSLEAGTGLESHPTVGYVSFSRLHPFRYSRLMNLSASGAFGHLSWAGFHSIFLPTR